MNKGTLLLPLALFCAACVPPPPPPPAAPPPPPPPPAAAPAAAEVPPPEGGTRWDVRLVTCGQILAASDDDRAAAVMFYYGFLASSAGIKVIDVSRIEENVQRVMHQCEETPNMTVPRAFYAVFGHRVRHHR